MTRSADLDRAYSLLVLLCEHDQPGDPRTSHALMAAFNIVSELHTPGTLVHVDRTPDRHELLAQAVEMTSSLANSAGDLEEALGLGDAAALLCSIRPKLSDRR